MEWEWFLMLGVHLRSWGCSYIFQSLSRTSVLSYDISNWLLQHPGLDGQEVSLKLHHDGHMGSFEDSSGKFSHKNNIYIFTSFQKKEKRTTFTSNWVCLFHLSTSNFHSRHFKIMKDSFNFLTSCSTIAFVTGKSYEVVSCRAQDPDALVFLSSDSEPKIGNS